MAPVRNRPRLEYRNPRGCRRAGAFTRAEEPIHIRRKDAIIKPWNIIQQILWLSACLAGLLVVTAVAGGFSAAMATVFCLIATGGVTLIGLED